MEVIKTYFKDRKNSLKNSKLKKLIKTFTKRFSKVQNLKFFGCSSDAVDETRIFKFQAQNLVLVGKISPFKRFTSNERHIYGAPP